MTTGGTFASGRHSHQRNSGRRNSRQRRGLSLLEVLIALAALAAVMGAVGPLLDIGLRAAVRADFETQAIGRAQSRLDELASGVVPRLAARDVPFEDDTEWRCDVLIEDGPAGTQRVTVRVWRNTGVGHVEGLLTRLMASRGNE